MALDPTSSTAYESVPPYNSQHQFKAKPSQRLRKPLRALKGLPFIPKSKSPSTTRLIVFLLPEAGFLALGTFCFLKPIPLSISNDDPILREAKAVTTAIAIVWHTVAVFMAQDLTVRVFSAECMAQYRLTGKLTPGETDRVSAIHAGLFSRMKHFVSPTATPRYRVALAAAVILMIMGPIAPSVLNIGSISVQILEEIQLTRLTMGGALYPVVRLYDEDVVSQRAEFILRMETLENGTFGFETVDERVLIPWPQPDLKSNQEGIITYRTDVVKYDYECSWNAPVLNKSGFTINDSLTHAMEAGRTSWQVRLSEANSFLSQSEEALMIMPLVNTAILSTTPPTLNSSISGYIFLWNSARDLENSLRYTPDPTIPSTNLTNTYGYGDAVDEPRANILLCDPHLQILSGEVRLEGGKLYFNQLANDSARIGNIPDYPANGMVTQALVSAITMQPVAIAPDDTTSFFPPPQAVVSDHAASLFLDPSAESQSNILPLKLINNNMNTYLQIAAKAYLSGAFADKLLSRRWMAQNGTRMLQNPALVSSKPFLLALTASIASLAVLLLSLHVMVQRYHDIQLFDLQNFTIREKPCLGSESERPMRTTPTELP